MQATTKVLFLGTIMSRNVVSKSFDKVGFKKGRPSFYRLIYRLYKTSSPRICLSGFIYELMKTMSKPCSVIPVI